METYVIIACKILIIVGRKLGVYKLHDFGPKAIEISASTLWNIKGILWNHGELGIEGIILFAWTSVVL